MKILLVEDKYQEMETAVRTLEDAGHEVIKAKNLHEAGGTLYGVRKGTEKIDGVITDVFFPTWDQGGFDDPALPCGVSVAVQCHQLGIPFVFCSSNMHHAFKLEWIFQLTGIMKWKMVDGREIHGDPHRDEGTKDWAAALETLTALIAAK